MTANQYAKEHGWRFGHTRGGHFCFQKGKQKIFFSATPSDVRAGKNLLAQLRRADRVVKGIV